MKNADTAKAPVKTVALDRAQTRLAVLDLESLIEANHPARTIWELSGRFDLNQFEQQSEAGKARRAVPAGRPDS